MIPRLKAPVSRKMITLEVRERVSLSPNFASVTLGGPELKDLVVTGADQTVRLFFPREGQRGLRMPTFSNETWMPELMLLPKSVRPWVRTLTIRRARPADDEVDIEFALHGNSPMSEWVRRVRPGDPAGIFDMGTTYRPPDDVGAQLIVADESALPAALAILDGSPESLAAQVFLEVPAAADIRRYDTADGVRVHWLSRDDPGLRPGTSALEAVQRASLPQGRFYTWVAGESRLATSLRRHLVSERGAAKADISFAGYWRHGWSSPG